MPGRQTSSILHLLKLRVNGFPRVPLALSGDLSWNAGTAGYKISWVQFWLEGWRFRWERQENVESSTQLPNLDSGVVALRLFASSFAGKKLWFSTLQIHYLFSHACILYLSCNLACFYDVLSVHQRGTPNKLSSTKIFRYRRKRAAKQC